MKKVLFFGMVWGIAMSLSCQKNADVVILNAKVWTVDEQRPTAKAVAIKTNIFYRVGDNEQVQSVIGRRTRVIDAGGRLVLPGFNDAHLHFIGGGLALLNVDLLGCRTPQEIQIRLRQRAAELPAGTWITGRGWDHTLFNAGKWPDKALLDEAAPNHPVFVRRVDGHVGWGNSMAIRLANVTSLTPNPDGGEVFKDSNTGEPTGIFSESAMSLIDQFIPPDDEEKRYLAATQALALARKYGLTSIQDNSGINALRIYHRLQHEGKLTLRVSEWLDFDEAADPEKLRQTISTFRPLTDDHFLRMGLLKGFVDGTLGSRTAYFFEPYFDDPTELGLPQMTQDELTRMVCNADSLGLQVGLHCIGAKANWMAIQSYAEAERRFGKRDRRHRLEHAQVLRVRDIPELSKFGIIASMQPTHCTSDLRWAEQRIGHERSRGAYAWRKLFDSGVKIAFGTDWPVEPLDPMRGIYSAVTRRNIETGEPIGGWFPEECLNLAEAIRLYTLDSAYAEFQEQVKGSITAGKFADLIILSQDLFSIPAEQILHTRVTTTIFDGQIVYQSE